MYASVSKSSKPNGLEAKPIPHVCYMLDRVIWELVPSCLHTKIQIQENVWDLSYCFRGGGYGPDVSMSFWKWHLLFPGTFYWSKHVTGSHLSSRRGALQCTHSNGSTLSDQYQMGVIRKGAISLIYSLKSKSSCNPHATTIMLAI